MDHQTAFVPDIGGKKQAHGGDEAIAELAGRQHGVVARTQVLGLGLGAGAIEHRMRTGRLHVLHRGVYAVGHRVVSVEAQWMADVLAGGPGATLSHRSAGTLWVIRSAWAKTTEVTIPGARRPRDGIVFHQALLPSDEITRRHGIPVTTVPRTLLDLASVLDRRALERAIGEAEVRRLTDPLSLEDLLERYPRRPGSAAIRAILAEGRLGVTVTRSELEERFATFLDRHRLPRPELNVRLHVRDWWLECDCVWRAARLIVELDGQAFHLTQRAFERDRARDRALHADGWRVVRITWSQLRDEPTAIAADLRTMLGT